MDRPRIGVLHTLPFHAEILKHVRRDVTVTWAPEHRNDFLEHAEPGRRQAALDPLRGCDAVVVADYPYPMIREALGPATALVGTRHSLASRNNTWMPDHAEADWIVTWSAWDEEEFRARGIQPRRGFLRCGCLWTPTDADTLGIVRSPERTLLWAPTWNPDLSHRDEVLPVLVGLRERGWRVRVFPHGATRWREPEVVAGYAAAGLDVVPADHLMEAIAGCDVLVSDCSGMGLTGLLLPGGGPPVIWVGEMPKGPHPQVDPRGPEWGFPLDQQAGLRVKTFTAGGLLDAIDNNQPLVIALQAEVLGTRTAHPGVLLDRALTTLHAEGSL